MKKFYIFNAGCIRRGKDSIWLQKYLQKNDWVLTSKAKKADLIIIATCGVVKENEKKSLEAVAKSVKKSSAKSKIIITGCLPNINPDSLRELGDFIFIPTNEIYKFDEVINARVSLKDVKQPDTVTEGNHITNYLIARSLCRRSRIYRALFWKFGMNNSFLAASVFLFKIEKRISGIFKFNFNNKIVPYYNISIARGCKSNCAFCATKLAIGEVVSRPVKEVIEEFKNGIEKNYKVIQLISEDTGCYGLDIGTNVAELLKDVFEFKGDYKLSIIDFHPRWLIKFKNELIPLLIKNQDKVKEIFVPMQTGSNHVLGLMQRDHTVEEIKPIISELVKSAPKIKIRTSILVGFPGETDADFEDTVKFIKETTFAEISINRYEDRPNTPSSKMSGKVPHDIIEKRAWYLVDELGCLMLS